MYHSTLYLTPVSFVFSSLLVSGILHAGMLDFGFGVTNYILHTTKIDYYCYHYYYYFIQIKTYVNNTQTPTISKTNNNQLDLDRYTGNSVDVPVSPIVAAGLTGMTYYGPAGIRVASLGGIIGCGIVSATYTTYKFILGKPYGSYGFLWF